MIWPDFFKMIIDNLLDFMDDTRLFFGISLWDLIIIFLSIFDLTMIISAIFQSQRKDDET